MSRAEQLAAVLGEGDRSITAACLDRLSLFESLVRKWNPSINVVGRSTVENLWVRHILDSAQLFQAACRDDRMWLDIGSGGGFPGLVVAVLAEEFLPDLTVHLVESDKRKAVFLSEAARQMRARVCVHTCRSEDLPPQGADIVSARALAPLVDLCAHAQRHLKPGGRCAFLKGAAGEAEIENARKSWDFGVDRIPSKTETTASVLFLRDLKRV